MKYEKSAGTIIFKEGDRVEGLVASRVYLLLAYPGIKDKEKIIWGFPKGGVDEGESEDATARREVTEETGLTELSFVSGFKEKEKYLYKREGDFIRKTVVYFLAQTAQQEVTISLEHVGFEWLPVKEAIDRLTFKNAKELLQKAEDFLNCAPPVSQLKLV